jgi:membrane-associated HD superfamily phosphohydrolase
LDNRPVKKIRIGPCYGLAWKSFAKWWIPLCLISGVLFVFGLLPKILAAPKVQAVQAAAMEFFDATARQDLNDMELASDRMNQQVWEMATSMGQVTLYLFPAVALLTVILLMYANRAVKDERRRDNPPLWLAYVTLVHVIEVAVKTLAFCLLIVPGVYLYVKLFFVSLVMLERKKGAFAAIAQSWRMTRGNFWTLLLLILLNCLIQAVAGSTVIGVIPATGFANTARAAAFRTLLAPEPPNTRSG